MLEKPATLQAIFRAHEPTAAAKARDLTKAAMRCSHPEIDAAEGSCIICGAAIDVDALDEDDEEFFGFARR